MPADVSPPDRIRLRLLETADAGSLVEGLNDWGIAQWLPTVPFPYGEEHARAFITESVRTTPPQAYVLADNATGKLLGVIGLSRNGGIAELGYWLLPLHQGKGLMREAIERLIARRDKALVSIFATVDPGNARSMKLLESTGFSLTGKYTREAPNRQGNLVVLRYQRDLE